MGFDEADARGKNHFSSSVRRRKIFTIGNARYVSSKFSEAGEPERKSGPVRVFHGMSVHHMSSDYRPRGASSSAGGSSGGAGGRRRRGGRSRGGAGRSSSSGEHRTHSHANGTPGAPAKKEHPIAKLFGWLTGKKKKTDAKPAPSRSSSPRPDFKERDRDRPPRADRPPREDRPPKPDPTPQEIVSPKLYVGNLAYEAAESDLFDLFSKVGAVKNVEVAMDRHANRSKGFGFVEMETLETAKDAAAKLNRTDFMGRQIVVSGAKLDKRTVNPREPDSSPEAEA
jgi:hypothetical protein